jgi:hypothetical protein
MSLRGASHDSSISQEPVWVLENRIGLMIRYQSHAPEGPQSIWHRVQIWERSPEI